MKAATDLQPCQVLVLHLNNPPKKEGRKTTENTPFNEELHKTMQKRNTSIALLRQMYHLIGKSKFFHSDSIHLVSTTIQTKLCKEFLQACMVQKIFIILFGIKKFAPRLQVTPSTRMSLNIKVEAPVPFKLSKRTTKQ